MRPNYLEIGDKVICIKTFNGRTGFKMTYYVKDNIYIITDNRNNTIDINTNYNIPICFNFNENSYYYFKEYFITLKELRKQKLDKIQKCISL